MSGDSYNVYDEQNEIRGAEMLEKYRQMHSGEHDDLDVRPSEFARDNPMTDDPRQPNAKRKKKAKKKFKQAAREAAEGGLRETIDASGASTTVRGGGDDEAAEEETTELTSTNRFGALRKLIRQRSSLTSTFLEHATDANILKVYNKWVAHQRSDGFGDQQFHR